MSVLIIFPHYASLLSPVLCPIFGFQPTYPPDMVRERVLCLLRPISFSSLVLQSYPWIFTQILPNFPTLNIPGPWTPCSFFMLPSYDLLVVLPYFPSYMSVTPTVFYRYSCVYRYHVI